MAIGTAERLITDYGTHIGQCSLCLRKHRRPAENLWQIEGEIGLVLCSWCDVEEKHQWLGKDIPFA